MTGIRTEEVIGSGLKKSVKSYLFYAHPSKLRKEKRGQYLFESPGDYRIKVTFEDFEGNKIESNVLSIEVKEPSGKDAEAYEYLKYLPISKDKDVYYGNFLLRSYVYERPKIFQKQKEFISKFPNSHYARYLYYSLGLTYCSREKEKDEGITLLEKAVGYDDFIFADDTLTKLIEILSKQGKSGKAEKYKEIYTRQFPNTGKGRDYIEEAISRFRKEQKYELVREYALLPLNEPNEISCDEELQLADIVKTDMNTPQAPIGQDWVQKRRKDVTVKLHAWKRLLDTIDQSWDPNDLPLRNVLPPVATGLPAGVAPSAIEDTNLRTEYMVAIEKSRQKAERYNKQYRLRKWLKRFPPRAERYIVRAYSKQPFNLEELKQYLDNYTVEEKTKAKILNAVTKNMLDK